MMSAVCCRGIVLISVGLTATAVADDRTADDVGFVSMFDGKTLTGWTVAPPAAKQEWTVEDGVIVGRGSQQGRSYLVYHDHNIADFELRLSYRFPGKGNSGISIRARKDETGRRDFQAYHADLGDAAEGQRVLGLWDFHTPGRTEHVGHRGQRLVIDGNDRPTFTPIDGAVTPDDIRRGDWNDVRIVASDNRFSFFINGKPAAEFVEHLPPERRLRSGMIQLQLHDPGMEIQFRDLRIRIDNR